MSGPVKAIAMWLTSRDGYHSTMEVNAKVREPEAQDLIDYLRREGYEVAPRDPDAKCLVCILDELYDVVTELEQDWNNLADPEKNLIVQVKQIIEEYRSI